MLLEEYGAKCTLKTAYNTMHRHAIQIETFEAQNRQQYQYQVKNGCMSSFVAMAARVRCCFSHKTDAVKGP
jgi:hypothetical protein